jgi:hypothetical protein
MLYLHRKNMVAVAQSVRALDCGSKGRGFESHLPPMKSPVNCFSIDWTIFLSINHFISLARLIPDHL